MALAENNFAESASSRSVTKAKGKKNVVIIDDHPILREGLRQLLNEEPNLYVSGEAENVHKAMEVIEQYKPDIAIVDVSLEGGSGIALIKRMRATYPGLATLVLSMHDELLYAERALRAGANGYIMKQEKPEKAVQAINRILDGDIYLSEKMASTMVHKLLGSGSAGKGVGIESLSDRELEVFQLIGNGWATRQISEQLHVSIKTVESHRARIKEKMKEWLPFNKTDVKKLSDEFKKVTYATIITTGLVAILQGFLLTIAFIIFNIKAAIFWGLIAAIFSFLPIIGVPLIWIPFAIVYLVQHNYFVGIGLIVAGMIINYSEYFVRPPLQKKIGDIHPLTSILGVFVGIPAFGIVGIVVGPLLISYLLIIINIFKKEYL